MAVDQSYLTYGGIGKDPSGSSDAISTGWDYAIDDGGISYTPTAGGSAEVPSTVQAVDGEGTVYSGALSIIGDNWRGALFKAAATGDAEVECVFQWYNPTGEGYDDAGNLVEGVWNDYGDGSLSADAIEELAEASTADEWPMITNGTKVRLKVVCTDSDSSGVADVSATINAGLEIRSGLGKGMLDNNTIANPVTYGGIGADPS